MGKAPTQRGFRQVMLSEEAYAALVAYRDGAGLPSLGAAVLQAIAKAQVPDPEPFDVERAILFCRLDGKTAQRLRDFIL